MRLRNETTRTPNACIDGKPADRRFTAAAVALVLLALILLPTPRMGAWSPANEDRIVRTVFLVRHAEKAAEPREDPPLSEIGVARARNLARILGNAGITRIYSSQYLRTTETAGPLAEQLGIPVTRIELKIDGSNPRRVSDDSIRETITGVYDRTGGDVLIVGHSNTVPAMIAMLGAGEIPEIAESEYDDLFIVTVLGRGEAKLTRLKYWSAR